MTAEPRRVDIAAALQASGGPEAGFGHRDHLRLAWSVLVTYGPVAGEETVCTLIRVAARANGFEDRYHETTTRFWCRAMAERLGDQYETFDAFYDRNPQLHDKTLVKRHFSQPLLETGAAFEGWVDPDLAPLSGGDDPSPDPERRG